MTGFPPFSQCVIVQTRPGGESLLGAVVTVGVEMVENDDGHTCQRLLDSQHPVIVDEIKQARLYDCNAYYPVDWLRRLENPDEPNAKAEEDLRDLHTSSLTGAAA